MTGEEVAPVAPEVPVTAVVASSAPVETAVSVAVPEAVPVAVPEATPVAVPVAVAEAVAPSVEAPEAWTSVVAPVGTASVED